MSRRTEKIIEKNRVKKAYEKISEGLNEALSIARAETKPAKLHVPAELNVKSIRTKLRLSQDEFAQAYGFTIDQIKAWEQRRAHPLGGMRAYLMMIEHDPKRVLSLLRTASTKNAA